MIHLEHITRTYGAHEASTRALSDVSLDIPAGLSSAEAVGRLLLRYPARIVAGESPPIIAFLNGRNVDVLTPEEAALEDGDELLLATPIGGG